MSKFKVIFVNYETDEGIQMDLSWEDWIILVAELKNKGYSEGIGFHVDNFNQDTFAYSEQFLKSRGEH